jgi:hypothetical protein
MAMAVYIQVNTRYQLNRRLGGPQGRFERYGEEKNPALTRIELRSSTSKPRHYTEDGSLLGCCAV